MVDLARRRLFSRAPKAQISTETAQRMPWLVEEQAFIDGCTRCGKCMEACETAIIFKGEAGFPEVDFNLGECTFCEKCADVCPEPLFVPRTETAWKQTVELADNCLALNGVDCRVCGEMCDYAAITFRLQIGGVAKPILQEKECTGCGACIKPCPSNAIKIKKAGSENELSR
ncbi:ferredoxin-type protein NapF [Vibrio sp. SCSIO 43137]|uniref:ferredoxin-type protein NapF n=1 Tax=Vibrio sp. SCSIO 43137 TaxID=3021011 RepID=UPI002306EAE6|nr:ferredoxin-type protein NapF [Vibrio sp. SCSIO 43137]WCE32352.1 ferredoxin-type protein NapF [Vibrio sp. SCSIO 43137]